MYFDLLPNISYRSNSNKELIIAKNIFIKYKINKDTTQNKIIFTKYRVQPGETIQSIAEKYYGDRYYDWVIILINQMVNPILELPLSEEQIKNSIKKEGKNPSDIAYCLDHNQIKYPSNFYTKRHKINNDGVIEEVPGHELFTPISYFEDEIRKNEERSTLYLLRTGPWRSFIDNFEIEMNKYR